MSVLAHLSMQRISSRLPDFPGSTIPEKLASGRAQAEQALRKYVPDFAFDVAEAEQVTRTVDAWAARNEQSLSDAMAQSNNQLPTALHLAMGSSSQVRDFVIASFTMAAAGLGPWLSGDVARAVGEGEHVEAWAEMDAESRLQTFGIIVALEREGELEEVMAPKSVTGVGALPAAAWVVVVIATVIFAAAVVTTIYLNRRLTLNNRLMRDLCERAEARGDREAVLECIKATKDLQISFLDDVGSKLMTGLLILGGAYLAVRYGLPMLLGAARGSGDKRSAFARNDDRVPLMTEAQSKARIKELRKQGCKVHEIELPNGDIVVAKECP